MEQPDQLNGVEENPSYWESVGIAALIFAIFTFAINTVFKYTMASGSGGAFLSMISIAVVCLCGAFGGMLAVWHYAKTYDISFKLGKGALIGLLTGIVIAIILLILNKLWQIIDPGLHQQIVEASIEKLEAADIPEDQLETIKQQMKEGTSFIRQLIGGLLMYGIPNIITGMIGVPLFAKEEEDY